MSTWAENWDKNFETALKVLNKIKDEIKDKPNLESYTEKRFILQLELLLAEMEEISYRFQEKSSNKIMKNIEKIGNVQG